MELDEDSETSTPRLQGERSAAELIQHIEFYGTMEVGIHR